MRSERWLDALLGTMGGAVADVRGKLIDEGWFGRRSASPDRLDGSSLGWTREDERGPSRQSFEELWAPRERDDAPGLQREEPGHDIDR